MPVPDIQEICPDFELCAFCSNCRQDNHFCYVFVDNEKEGEEKEQRVVRMCKGCSEKCQTDKQFERYATEKVFNLKLGAAHGGAGARRRR